MPQTRISLLVQIRDLSDSESWSEFVAIYSPVITKTALRFGVQPEDVDDIRQEVFVQMMATIQRFSKDARKGRFRNYLAQITANKIRDRWRKSSRQSGNIENPALIPDEAETTEMFEEELNRQVMASALLRVRGQSRETTWNCFHQHVLLKRSAALVAQELKITENAVFVNCSRITARVREAAHFLKKEADCAQPVLPK
ncbi:RNA polymerase sigma factor [Thalassoglobus sp.]|uniref:RNA polymerase sigma factor n=1 Tax=Thalassoglobus sp. TaxID=2795869 RepID=UPI003AA988C9